MNVQLNHLLKPYTTYQIGGVADAFISVKTEEELLEALEWGKANNKPTFILGGGSNLIFSDQGFRGLVIRLAGGTMKQVHLGEASAPEDPSAKIQIEAFAGLRIVDLLKKTVEQGWTGLEEWNGLPGTVGGAVRGNAGCFGLETKDRLLQARIWTPNGVEIWSKEQLNYGYRESALKHHPERVVLSAIFELERGDPAAIHAKMQQIMKARIQKQPPGLSTGSFFKNPIGDHAGRLIEAAGCKGLRVGGAEISTQHANFLVNKGGATAEDVTLLAKEVMARVYEHFGIQLEPEVMIVASE